MFKEGQPKCEIMFGVHLERQFRPCKGKLINILYMSSSERYQMPVSCINISVKTGHQWGFYKWTDYQHFYLDVDGLIKCRQWYRRIVKGQ